MYNFIDKIQKEIEKAIPHYEDHPRVQFYLDTIYILIADGQLSSVTLSDVKFISRLNENGVYMDGNYATNTLYKMHQDKTGWISF